MVAVIHKEEHLNSNKLPDNFELDTTTEEEEQEAFTEERNRTEYKPVVIIGNGPSGIILSYFLAGNWPYYNGLGESVNDMLHYRLLAGGTGENQEALPLSLVEQDLDFLSQGLEGRTTNPVALLFDSLNHPQADLGLELPSLLNWRFRSEKEIDHVVIGKGPPGGAWQSMDGNVLTISLGCWMELPGLNFREWEAEQEERCCRESRASVASVAQYYCDYVKTQGLDKYFLPNSVVTEVRRVPQKFLSFICDNLNGNLNIDVEETQERSQRRHTVSGVPLINGSTNNSIRGRARNRSLWRVKGYRRLVGQDNKILLRPFSYLTPNVVLATGASDKPNALNVPGEDLPFVLHSLNELEHLITSGKLTRDSDPVMVVGAGLCAADAIIAARFHSVPVKHVFRRSVDDPALIFRQLPENMYPEYHKVYQMMKDPLGYDNYKAYSEYSIARISPDRRVNIVGPSQCGTVKVSYIAVCIGSHPDLSFLPPEMKLDLNLGIIPGSPVDCKSNPVAIDSSSHECVREPGLFALGPVAGENFVRFLQGGALAITNHLVKEQPHLLKT